MRHSKCRKNHYWVNKKTAGGPPPPPPPAPPPPPPPPPEPEPEEVEQREGREADVSRRGPGRKASALGLGDDGTSGKKTLLGE